MARIKNNTKYCNEKINPQTHHPNNLPNTNMMIISLTAVSLSAIKVKENITSASIDPVSFPEAT
ncbi:hypothetical protein HW555_013755 [Spodoptera exigua]|uniref:Uncharacterized protein n=1 Tax=Spodoptera exigua TaxID=7107 RepID=A0A835L270_SPOEX|nr:hypothetical protein HW555_013755 [Spodoptera exigua]